MSHILVALIVVLPIIIIPLFFIIMNKIESTKRREKMLVFFSNLGAAYNLSFTGQEILNDKIIGLDGPRRKVLIVEENEKKYNSQIIDLYEVNSCKVKKIYTEISSTDYKKNSMEDYLNSIALEFDFKNGKTPVAVLFYRVEKHSLYNMPELETKTKHWEGMLSKMLHNKQQGLQEKV